MLVVDDEPQIRRALRIILRDAGFEVEQAGTVEEALDAASVRPPQAAIVDLVLPDGDGIEVTRRLREWSNIPILVLSAIGEESEKVRALEAGADDYVTKPFGSRELLARLEAALRRADASHEEPVIRAEGLEVDLAARVVVAAGEEVHLTPIEFDLLRALARNRGRLMTHRALLLEVWGPGTATTSRCCARTSPTCAARSSRPAAVPLHPDRPGRRLPLRRLIRPSRNLYGRPGFLDTGFTGADLR